MWAFSSAFTINSKGWLSMKKKEQIKLANITFHNPNTPEETVKLLIRVGAENMADYMKNELPKPKNYCRI